MKKLSKKLNSSTITNTEIARLKAITNQPSAGGPAELREELHKTVIINGAAYEDPLCHHVKEYQPEGLNVLYLVTYKKLAGKPQFVCEFDYDIPIRRLRDRGSIIDIHYETDKDRRLHFHALWEARKNVYVQTFHMKGYSFDIKEVYDLDGCHWYMTKQTHNKYENTQLLDCLTCRNSGIVF